MQINKQWLDRQLKELHVDICVLDKVLAFKKRLESLLTYRLSLSGWTLSEFFVLSIAIHITDELLSKHLYQFEINANDRCLRSLNQNDVKRVSQKYYQYYYEKLILLAQLSKSKGMVGAYPAIEWLELVTSEKKELYIPQEIILYKITEDVFCELNVEIKSSGMIELPPKNMAEAIRFHHYKLDPILGKEGIFPIQWYDLNKTAELVKLTPDELISECFQNQFGPYLKMGSFEITGHCAPTVTQDTIAEVSVPSYPYNYRGLVRLLKESAPFSSIEISLRAFYQGSDIYVGSGNDYTLIRLQSSLAEAVQGINKFIKLNKGQKITRDQLVFIKHELEEFKTARSKNPLILIPHSQAHFDLEHSIENNDNQPIFSKQIRTYEISYMGIIIHQPASKGLEQIAYLLINPHKLINSIQLMQMVQKADTDVESTTESLNELSVQGICEDAFRSYVDGPMIDTQALDEYKKAVTRLTEQINEASEIGDTDKVEELKNEQEDILTHILKSTNHKRQSRAFNCSAEKARIAVNKNITGALKKIKKDHTELHQYLIDSLKLGNFCSYIPKH